MRRPRAFLSLSISRSKADHIPWTLSLAIFSTEGKGLFLTEMGSIAWLPLSDITSAARVKELVDAEEAQVEQHLKSSKSQPGLREQYDIQLEMLKDPDSVDGEIIVVPFYFPSPTGISIFIALVDVSVVGLTLANGVYLAAKPQPGKTYLSLICALNHPFSRGSIVSLNRSRHSFALQGNV